MTLYTEDEGIHRIFGESLFETKQRFSQCGLYFVFGKKQLLSDESSFKFIAARVEKTIAEVLIKRILFHNEGWKMRKYRIPKFR